MAETKLDKLTPRQQKEVDEIIKELDKRSRVIDIIIKDFTVLFDRLYAVDAEVDDFDDINPGC